MLFFINLLTRWQGNFYLPNRMRSLLGHLDFKYILHGYTFSYIKLPFLYRKEERYFLLLFHFKGFLKNSAKWSLHTWICTIDNLWTILLKGVSFKWEWTLSFKLCHRELRVLNHGWRHRQRTVKWLTQGSICSWRWNYMVQAPDFYAVSF